MDEKYCCFIGHREIRDRKELSALLKNTVIYLLKTGFTCFVLGSRGEFNYLCYDILTELKKDYPVIKRIAFQTKSDGGWDEDKYKRYCPKDYEQKRGVDYNGWYEVVCKPDFVYESGKAAYVERNQYIIDISDLCVFYYDKDYKPPVRNRSSRSVGDLWTSEKSGTALAYKYALKKKKPFVNLFELLK